MSLIINELDSTGKELCLCQEILNEDDLDELSTLVQLEKLLLYDCLSLSGRLGLLSNLVNLKSLKLPFAYITDDDMINLSTLTKLEHLDITQNNITGLGFAHLRELTQMKRLIMTRVPIIDDGIVEICKSFPNLEEITLMNKNPRYFKKQISCQGLLTICMNLKSLSTINLQHVNIVNYMPLILLDNLETVIVNKDFNESYQRILAFPILENVQILKVSGPLAQIVVPKLNAYISIRELEISEKVGDNINELAHLTKLTIAADLDNEDLKVLSNLTSLTYLNLRNNENLNDNCLQYLTKLTNLKTLDLDDTMVNEESLQTFKDSYFTTEVDAPQDNELIMN